MSDVATIIQNRRISEILHFTTENGFLGAIACGYLLPRARLRKEQLLEFILQENVDTRKDSNFIDYNSLSISKINRRFFEISENHYHPDLNWIVMSFDPIILAHEGVKFVTANNIWPASKRGEGAEGLNALFAERVAGRCGAVSVRNKLHAENAPTNPEAEVLYPGPLSLEHLGTVYVRTDEEADNIHAQLAGVGFLRDINVVVEEGKFT